jgi:hypothetical protein
VSIDCLSLRELKPGEGGRGEGGKGKGIELRDCAGAIYGRGIPTCLWCPRAKGEVQNMTLIPACTAVTEASVRISPARRWTSKARYSFSKGLLQQRSS